MINLANLNSEYQTVTLDNGLKVFIYSHQELTNQFAQYMVHAGGNDIKPGLAHFVEHTKFAKPDGDWFDEFSKTGADCNAYTNYHQTAYYFTCANDFFTNLQILTQMMEQSHLTQEVLEKEFKIISQEINMYDQMPEWVITNRILKNMNVDAYQDDIAGTIEDISNISVDDLQSTFDKYYHLHNMSLTIATNHDVDEVITWLENNIHIKVDGEYVAITPQACNVSVNSDEIKFNGHNSLLSYAYKFNYNQDNQARILDYITLQIVDLITYSRLNNKYSHLLEQGIINDTLYSGPFCNEDLIFYGFDMISEDNITAHLDQLWGLDKNLVETGIKQLQSRQLKVLSNKQRFMQLVQEFEAIGLDILDYFQILGQIDQTSILANFDKLSKSYEKCSVVLKNGIINKTRKL